VICLLARRRLGAYLDGALDNRASRAVIHHLDSCLRCRQQIATIRRMTALLRTSIPTVVEPDWTGFWPGIVRGVVDGPRRGTRAAGHRRGRRWILGGAAAAAAVALSVAVVYERLAPPVPEESALVTAAGTQYPGGTMVYHTPDKVAVVWVFDD
jgi:anti-sigma factor RsiW